jgi:hypothetical protein
MIDEDTLVDTNDWKYDADDHEYRKQIDSVGCSSGRAPAAAG